MTKAKADRIKDGMSRRQVIDIVGLPGKPVSRFRAGPLPPFTPRPRHYPEYEWRNSDGSYLRVGFHNDKVVSMEWRWLQ